VHRIVVTAVLLAVLACAGPASAAEPAVADDPAGGRSWEGRVSGTGDGACVVVRQRGAARATRFCGPLGDGRLYVYGRLLQERRGGPRKARTVLVVGFSPEVVRASLRTPEGVKTYRRRSDREPVLLVVLAGRVERDALSVVARRGANTISTSVDPTPGAQDGVYRAVPDRDDGRSCVRWIRDRARFSARPAPERGPRRCRELDGLDAVAYADEEGEGGVLAGVAGPRVGAVRLRRRGTERALRIDPATRTFVAELSRAPRGLTLVLVGRDGERVTRDVPVED